MRGSKSGRPCAPTRAKTIETLRRRGLDLHILSGDRPEAVLPLAQALGIRSAKGGLDPAAKIAEIESLRMQGRKVLMVGDGMNDAPALAAAHASLSPVTGADLVQAQADAIFLGDRLAPVARSLDVARQARALMRQNLGGAIVYNLCAVPLAVAGEVDASHRRGRHVVFVDPRHAERLAHARPGTRHARERASRRGESSARARGAERMNVLAYLVPIALMLGFAALLAFLWSIRSGQYDDVEGTAYRILSDDDVKRPLDGGHETRLS